MPRPCIFLICILGILCVQTAYCASSLPESPTGDANPSLTCVLFSTPGCTLECTVIGKFFGHDYNGSCASNEICVCSPIDRTPIDVYTIWKEKFTTDADYVYSQIGKSRTKAVQTLSIFKEPHNTAEQYKQQLRQIISPYQYSKLKTDDHDLAAEFIKNNKIDKKLLEKQISRQLRTMLFNSKYRPAQIVNYKERFRMILQNIRDIGTLYNFTYKVARLQNKDLENVLKEYFKKNNIEKPTVNLDEEPYLDEVLHYTFVNELIKRNYTR